MDDSIDLHTFRPAECGDVVEEFVRDAHERGLSVVLV
ncbi:MAG TPA: Smr/MutS family protein [Kofleriaceae bacterium]|jgi:DNA-nicking Smr family endonuclease